MLEDGIGYSKKHVKKRVPLTTLMQNSSKNIRMNTEETSPLSFKFESMTSQQSTHSGRGSNRSRKSSRRKSIDSHQLVYDPKRRKTIRVDNIDEYTKENEIDEYSDDYEYVPRFKDIEWRMKPNE